MRGCERLGIYTYPNVMRHIIREIVICWTNDTVFCDAGNLCKGSKMYVFPD